jgi:hypothetical protein
MGNHRAIPCTTSWDIGSRDKGRRQQDSTLLTYSIRVYRHVPVRANKGDGRYQCQDRRVPR